MSIEMKPIGFVTHTTEEIPRSWKVSDVEGALVMDEKYMEGLKEIKPGERIYVIFNFHKSPEFTEQFMRIQPPVHDKVVGVFSTHSPFRPNPIGLSLVEVLEVDGTTLKVRGLDMMDQTPILDIKPESCSWQSNININ